MPTAYIHHKASHAGPFQTTTAPHRITLRGSVQVLWLGRWRTLRPHTEEGKRRAQFSTFNGLEPLSHVQVTP
jgi:hypothetical protein